MPKRILQGVVVSDKGDKTVVVKVERRLMHPLYKSLFQNRRSFQPMMLKTASRSVIAFVFRNAHQFQNQRPTLSSMKMPVKA